MKIAYLILLLCFSVNITFAALERGINNHKAGDVISVNLDEQIAAWCDFNKQIVVTQTSMLCVYNGKNTRSNSF